MLLRGMGRAGAGGAGSRAGSCSPTSPAHLAYPDYCGWGFFSPVFLSPSPPGSGCGQARCPGSCSTGYPAPSRGKQRPRSGLGAAAGCLREEEEELDNSGQAEESTRSRCCSERMSKLRSSPAGLRAGEVPVPAALGSARAEPSCSSAAAPAGLGGLRGGGEITTVNFKKSLEHLLHN